MSNYLHCPVCAKLYSNQTHVPRYSQCGGVCCSLCVASPCPLCKQVHSKPALDFLPIKDYIKNHFIDCICGKQTAEFIDGKNFLPYCRTCFKGYQKGVEMKNNSFGEFVDSVFVYFVDKLTSEGKKEIVWNVVENGNKGPGEKLMMVRRASQFFSNKVYCEVHLEKIAGCVSEDLEFLCENDGGGVKLSDVEGCKEVVKKYLNVLGLINESLHDQLYGNQKFNPIKSIFQAKFLRRGIRPTDICSFCKNIFGWSSVFQVTCTQNNSKCCHLVCKTCSKLTECKLDNNGVISNRTEKSIQYSNTCSNCENKFFIEYKTPLDIQDLVPFELICDHNVCRTCSNKAHNNKIYCKICRLYFQYTPKLNMILVNLLNQKELICPDHHLTVVQYSFHPSFSLYCDKCHKDFKGQALSELFFIIIKNYFRHLLDFLSAESLLPSKELQVLNSTTLRKHKLESISNLDLKNWFTIPDQIGITDPASQYSINKSEFCIHPSASILVTSIELHHSNIEAKLRISQCINDKIRPLKAIPINLSISNSTIDFSQSGYLPLISGNFYEFYLYDIEDFYLGSKIKLDTFSNSLDTSLKIFLNEPLDPEAPKVPDDEFSLIKCINFLKLPR